MRSMSRALASLIAVAASVLLGACGSTTAATSTAAQSHPNVSVLVAFESPDVSEMQKASGPCIPEPYTYSGSVTVTLIDQSGKVLGQGSAGTTTLGVAQNTITCVVTVHLGPTAIENVTQFGVEVANSSPIYFSASQAQKDGYQLGVSYS